METQKALEEIGLTESEIKAYLALLKLGTAAKGEILKETRTAPSKIYYVLEKLINKGLVSMIIKNNIKNFSAAPLERIEDYLKKKKQEIEKQEKNVKNIISELTKLQEKKLRSTSAEVFFGWPGLETVYVSNIMRLSRGDEVFIIGASKGENPERNTEFFIRYGKMAFNKGIKTKVIFNENSRDYVRKIEKEADIRYDKKFLNMNTPAEITIARDFVSITIMRYEPVLILIKDKEVTESFRQYFNELWKIAK